MPECSHAGHVIALFVDVRGDFILVGDLMKSMQLLIYKPEEKKLEMRARDFSPAWMCAASFLDNDTYLGAENNYNLYTLRKNDDAPAEEDRCRLQVVGTYHLSEFVNRFRVGSLVMKNDILANIPTMLYGTISGSLGIIASLPPETYNILHQLQEALAKVINGVGGFSQSEWRSFKSPFGGKNDLASSGFIDGDLCELVGDLSAESLQKVREQFESADDFDAALKLIEELSRLH